MGRPKILLLLAAVCVVYMCDILAGVLYREDVGLVLWGLARQASWWGAAQKLSVCNGHADTEAG